MRRALLAALFLSGCGTQISTIDTTWTMTLQAPSTDTGAVGPTVEWCPAMLFAPGFDPLSGQPLPPSDEAPAPTAITGTMSVANDDVYTLSPGWDSRMFGTVPIEFDVGPIGTFYSKSDATFTITTDGQVPGVSPSAVNVTRRVVAGSVSSENDFDLTVDFELDCDEIEAGDRSCDCEKQRFTWNVVSQGF